MKTLKHYCPVILITCLFFALSSCKKDNTYRSSATTLSNTPTPTKLGLYETDSSIYKLLFIAVPKIGTQTVHQFLIFDTGSGGMVIDAHEILPASYRAVVLANRTPSREST